MDSLAYYNHLMTHLETNKNIKKSVQSRFKRAFWLIGGAIVGGFIGRFGGWTGCVIGAFVGFVFGGVICYFKSYPYKDTLEVLRTMSDADKKNLVDGVQVLVESKSIDDLISFSDKQKQREKLLTLVKHFAYFVKTRGKTI